LAGDLPESPVPIRVTVPRESKHNFFDFKNSVAIASFGASLAGDALSTQNVLAYPTYKEMNPLARPFVQSRTGQTVYSAGGLGLMMGGMYWAHKTNHHKLERILPLALTGVESFWTVWNYRQLPQARADLQILRAYGK
jgi:hypothetical protein